MKSYWFRTTGEECCHTCGTEDVSHLIRFEDWQGERNLCVACYSTNAGSSSVNSREVEIMVQLANMLALLINPGVGFPIPPNLEEGEPPKDEEKP